MSVYNGGLDLLAGIATADLRWLLLKGIGYSFERDHDHVAELAPATNELTVSGYARLALAGGTRTVDDSADRIVYAADDPSFGTLGAGENASALVLFVHGTTDAASPLVAHFAFAPIDTGALDPFVVNLGGGIIAYTHEA